MQKMIPVSSVGGYSLHKLVHDGYVYVKIKKGIYGLKQAAILPQRTEIFYYPAFETVVSILNNSVSARVERYSNNISYNSFNDTIPSSLYCTMISLLVR